MRKLNHILLVDDDTINNFINEKLLKKLDIANKISVSLNGEEAITLLKKICDGQDEICPELILLDINMPVMDGFEFLEKYKGLNFPEKQSVIIVMLTTSTNPNDTERLNRAGISGYINKPLTEDKIRGLMKEFFNFVA
jgi:CheY-like chemotaxis protein